MNDARNPKGVAVSVCANPVLQKDLVEFFRYYDLYIPIIYTPEARLQPP